MSYTKDDYYNPTTDDHLGLRYGAITNILLGGQFTPTAGTSVGQIDLQLIKAGTPSGNVWVEVWSDTGADLPNAKIGSSSNTVACSAITDTTVPGETVVFTFSTPVPITPSTKYWLVLNGDYTTSSTDYIGFCEDNGNVTRKFARKGDGADSNWHALTMSAWFNEYYYVPEAANFFAIL